MPNTNTRIMRKDPKLPNIRSNRSNIIGKVTKMLAKIKPNPKSINILSRSEYSGCFLHCGHLDFSNLKP